MHTATVSALLLLSLGAAAASTPSGGSVAASANTSATAGGGGAPKPTAAPVTATSTPTKAISKPTAKPTAAPTSGASPTWLCGYHGSCYFVPDCQKGAQPVCPAADCNPVHGLYDAPKIINGDVNSFNYNGGPNHPPAVTNADDCCTACRNEKSCNLWSFCSEEGGCGDAGSCTALQKKYPVSPDPSSLFGTFGGSYTCTSNGRFSKLVCILRQTKDPAIVKQTGSSTTAAFTSGKLTGRKF